MRTDATTPAGRRIAIRPATPADIEFMYLTEVVGANADVWRFRGRMASPEEFSRLAFAGLELCQIIVDKVTGEPLGIATVYGLDSRNRLAHLACIDGSSLIGRGVALEGAILAAARAFRLWDLRMLLCEMTGVSVEAVASGIGRYFHEVARIPEYEFIRGEFTDRVIIRLYLHQCEQMVAMLTTSSSDHFFPSVVEVLRQIGLRPADLFSDPDVPLIASGLDSLAVLELVCAAEDARRADVPLEVLRNMATVGDLMAILQIESP